MGKILNKIKKNEKRVLLLFESDFSKIIFFIIFLNLHSNLIAFLKKDDVT